jgi:hypothetical protein
LWSADAVPAVVAHSDNQAVELGIKFRIVSPGFISGVRYFKSSKNTGMHLGSLWQGDGKLLARATFANESESGWQQVLFSSPIPVWASTTYVASYHTDVGYYAANAEYFSTAGFQAGPLRALADGEDGGNGVFRYGASAFPSESYHGANYWVDPIFTTDGLDTIPPAIGGIQVTDVTTNGATVRWTTDEPGNSRVEIGTTTAYGGSVIDASLVTSHVVQLSNLLPNTGYHLRVQSRDGANNQSSSGDITLTTATFVTPPNGPCLPRPNVSVSSARSGPGRLLVTVTVGTSTSTPNNRLVAFHFLPGRNALVDAGGQVGRTGDFTVAIPGRPAQVSFYLRPAAPGTAVTLPFLVVDDCGEFRTFVGGGVAAW